MQINLDFLTIEVILTFFLAMTRIGAFMVAAPLLSRNGIPVMAKVLLTAAIVLSFYPTILAHSDGLILYDSWHLAIAIFHEILVGYSMGVLMSLFFDSLVSFAHMAGIQMGQSSSNVFNPALSAPTSPTGTFIANVALMFFIFLNGIYHMLFLLKKSFVLVPLASYKLDLATLGQNYIAVFTEIFAIGMKIILPLIAIMFVIDVFVALFAKIMPQANMFFLMMPAKLIVGVFIIMFMLNILYLRMEQFYEIDFWDLMDKLFLG
ncbi:MAG: flagellar biosynthetic protein FliR [Cyanobacteria bacterium]|nr:flagellar biosynthetic protein FliR [Cyanobacteriota bacterium]MDA1021162.1 flagellar biosynthetic protein FliR [Cyanobacteriota bacterium]